MAKPPTSLHTLQPFSTTTTTRLQALYSDISRQKRSNPASFHSNVDWWRRALESIVSSGVQHSQDSPFAAGRLVLHAEGSLIDCLKMKGAGKPLAIGTVVYELSASKAIIPVSSFLSSQQSIYDPGWLPTRIASLVIVKPLWWTLEQMGIVGDESIFSAGSHSRGGYNDREWWGEYVMVSLIERAADAIVEVQQSKITSIADRLYDISSFKREFASVLGQDVISDEDSSVLLKFLERDRGFVAIDKGVIKFLDKCGNRDQAHITPVDRGILELKTAVTRMQAQIESLQRKIDECTRKASEALRHKRKELALNHLRTRKQLEDLNNKRLGSLTTLESTLITVEAAAGDIDIMRVYESSTATLRAILAHPSLQRDSVERTMDALAEANIDAKEIDEAIRAESDDALNIHQTDEDLKKELDQLVAEARVEGLEADEGEQMILKHKLAKGSTVGHERGIVQKTSDDVMAEVLVA
ncbi:hypothetical protein AMATHDRAFT_135662 [Amanita thiersii Skay4041]|uniref:Uncharacterized protein n=1 Tax=Amanita thiersii Skay4041 TaxID=703135 RepID=A0A2A9NUJ5_9AGAR|nr:hypothetical protein AMATHDRAFT_135662 [Amanita thiersii Skay4041]